MNRTEAERRLMALETRSEPIADEERRAEITEMFERMIQANIASGNIWSAYPPSDLLADIDRRIVMLRDLASRVSRDRSDVCLAIVDWLTEARTVAEDDLRVDRPVLNCAKRLQPLDRISHVELVSLWFGLEAGADWEVAERIDNG